MSSTGDFPTLTPPGTEPVVKDIYKDFTEEAWGQLRQRLTIDPPNIPIAQILGYSQSTPRRASVLTSETTTSAAYTDLATAGPTLTGLPPGQYLLIVSAFMVTSAGSNFALIAPAVNGATPSDDTAAITGDTIQGTHAGFTVANLSLDNNTVVSKYRVLAGSTGTFQYRNLIAVKMANL